MEDDRVSSALSLSTSSHSSEHHVGAAWPSPGYLDVPSCLRPPTRLGHSRIVMDEQLSVDTTNFVIVLSFNAIPQRDPSTRSHNALL